MAKEYQVRQMKIKPENIEKMNEIKESSGRTQIWIVNAALEYFFEHEWERLMR